MKKYFMKGTGEELEFGDTVEVTLTKKVKFTPEFVDLLLEEDIIEEQDDEKENEDIHEDVIEFAEIWDFIDGMLEANEELEKRIENLEEIVQEINRIILCPSTEAVQKVKKEVRKKNAKKVEVK